MKTNKILDPPQTRRPFTLPTIFISASEASLLLFSENHHVLSPSFIVYIAVHHSFLCAKVIAIAPPTTMPPAAPVASLSIVTLLSAVTDSSSLRFSPVVMVMVVVLLGLDESFSSSMVMRLGLGGDSNGEVG
ncbi:hypothetical protein PIB30_020960 [Stylosanthes scabra]|uniref:Uncharacterized protein n=1 Tax=Stylosanthes scabra TaxID=79078 RepID=A0ABU6R909_9FABA|nr:hypothetical protein [Stylosanthes scabra]